MSQSTVNNYQDSLALTEYFPLTGVFPSQGGGGNAGYTLGDIGIFAGNFDPAGVLTNGSLLPINQNQAVFSLIGTFYGGNGTTNFAVPNLIGTAMIGAGQGTGLSNEDEGAQTGAASVTLTPAQTPPDLGGSSQPFGNYEPSLPIQYIIGLDGVFPSQGGGTGALDTLGMVLPFAGNFAPGGFALANGQLLSIAQNTALFSILGTTYGGNGTTTFALPDLRGRDIIGASATNPLGSQIGSAAVTLANNQTPNGTNQTVQPFDNVQPSLALNYLIATQGIFPSEQGSQNNDTPLLGQIVAFAGNFAPSGWMLCNGQLLSISQNTALFQILGTTYGGDGVSTFALPNLDDRTVIAAGGSNALGAVVGANSATISANQLPPPSAPTGLALLPASDSGTKGDFVTNVVTPTITGNGVAGDTVTIDDGSTPVGAGTVANDGTWSIAISMLADGQHNFTAFQTDIVGNVSVASTSLSLTIDTAPPAAPTGLTLAPASDSGTLGDDITNVAAPTIIGNGVAGDTITIDDGSTPVGTGTVGNGGAWSITTSTLGDGQHTLTAFQTDDVGNVSLASTALTLTIDTTPPVAPSGLALAPASDSGTQGDNLTNVTTPTIIGSGEAGDTITLDDGSTMVGSGTVGNGGTWSVATSTLANGQHSLSAVETDAAGNVGPVSAALTLTIDTTPPAAPTGLALAPASDSGTLGDDLTNITSPRITGSGAAGDTVTLDDGSTVVGSGTVANDGTWSIPTSELANGEHSLTATQTDPAGNVSVASIALVLTIDNTPPAPPTGLALASASDSGTLGDNLTNVTTPAIAGTGAAGDTVTLDDGSTVVGSGTVANDGTWSIPTSELANGQHSLSAFQTDVVGNVSGTSGPLVVIIDTTTPAVSPATLAVFGDSGAQPIGIAAPTDTLPFTIAVTGLPSDGGITLADGITAVTQGEALTTAQLTGLEFTPASGLLSGSSTFAYLVTDSAGNASSGSATVAIAEPGDLTGDGQSDVLMNSNVTGALIVDEMTGAQLGYTQIGGLGPEWQFEGSGLFLGDGKIGELLRSNASGVTEVVEDTSGTASYTPIGATPSAWQFEGNGTLLGQATSDFLLWNNATDAVAVGSVSGGTEQMTQIGAVGSNWQFEGVGDFLGDGKTGFLMEDANSGTLVVGEDVGGAAQYAAVGGLGSEWAFEGAADLLGHGQDDFLIRSTITGALVVGEVTGGTAHYTQVGGVGPEWQFLGTGNYDGSNPAELMLVNTSGALALGTIKNGAATFTPVGGIGSEWNFHAGNVAVLS